ncbi:MAG: hypothetical protein HYZ09_00960 [Candidatus Kerfeldbacteria bacterium]|nr:hypothetical protein [Candidatus Kerfeldbacteria bacterium]
MRRIVFILLIVAAGITAGRSVGAAVVSLSPPALTIARGETVSVQVVVDTEGESVNVIQGVVTYPTELVDIVEVRRGSSILTLWPEPPTIDRARGIVRFVGGVPNGRIAHDAEVLTLLVAGQHSGSGLMSVDTTQSAVLLNDGAGTPTPLTGRPVTLTVSSRSYAAPTIMSSTHPDQTRWSPLRDFRVRWTLYPRTDYSFQLSPERAAEPDERPDDTTGEMFYPALTDGIWYFTLKERLAGDSWSEVARYRVMIDATRPRLTHGEIVHDAPSGEWLLVFGADDVPSGIEHLEMKLVRPSSRWYPFVRDAAWQVVENPVRLGRQPFRGAVALRAYDYAGNVVTTSFVSAGLRHDQARFFLLLGCGILVLMFGILALRVRRRSRIL